MQLLVLSSRLEIYVEIDQLDEQDGQTARGFKAVFSCGNRVTNLARESSVPFLAGKGPPSKTIYGVIP